MENKLVLVFTRNPELGKVKTRLAASIGNENALAVYCQLLEHTKNCLEKVDAKRWVLYSDSINEYDIWKNLVFEKKIQKGTDLGQRMQNAFKQGFEAGFKKIIIVGSDLLTLETKDIENAFDLLDKNDVVIGPAEDGGYYLLGLKAMPVGIFENKQWGTNTVFEDTLSNLTNHQVAFLSMKNDIDTIDDIKDIPEFKKYMK